MFCHLTGGGGGAGRSKGAGSPSKRHVTRGRRAARSTPSPRAQVIRPFTKTEYEQRMKALPEGQRRVVMSVIQTIDAWDYDVWSVQDFTDKGGPRAGLCLVAG